MPAAKVFDLPALKLLVQAHRDVSRARTPEEVSHLFLGSIGRLARFHGYLGLWTEGLPRGSYRIAQFREFDEEGRTLAPRTEHAREDFPSALPYSDAWWWRPDELPVRHGGAIGRLLLDDEPKSVDELDLSAEPDLAEALGESPAVIAVPIFHGGVASEWAVLCRPDREPVDPLALRFALNNFNLLSRTIRWQRLLSDTESLGAELKRQVDRVAALQRSLLPAKMPEVGGWSFASSYQPCTAAGGDYYDYTLDRDGRLVMLIADASGHGAAAAVVMAMLRAILHTYNALTKPGDDADFIPLLNRLVRQHVPDGMFVTALFIGFDTRTGEFDYLSCGHPQPRVRRADGRVEGLWSPGLPPLAVLEQVEECDALGGRGVLAPGDTMLLHTDGVNEAFDPARRPFGFRRMDEALASSNGDPEDVIATVESRLMFHTRGRPPEDDRAMLAIRREPVRTDPCSNGAA